MKENHLEMVAIQGKRNDEGSLVQRLPDGTVREAPMWCHDAIRKMASLPKRLGGGSKIHYLRWWEMDHLAVALRLYESFDYNPRWEHPLWGKGNNIVVYYKCDNKYAVRTAYKLVHQIRFLIRGHHENESWFLKKDDEKIIYEFLTGKISREEFIEEAISLIMFQYEHDEASKPRFDGAIVPTWYDCWSREEYRDEVLKSWFEEMFIDDNDQ